MIENRWTDEFLNKMRLEGDYSADACIVKLFEDGEIKHISEIFKKLDSNNALPPKQLFPSLEDFFEKTNQLPPGTDLERIRRGENVFIKNAISGALVLLCKSLPEGYQAPNLTNILHLSGSLERHPFHRLLAVLQMLINVNASRGFEDGGKAVITAQKLRLLHGGIRHICPKYLPDYHVKYGAFINHEDMLATIIAFSYLLLLGWRKLGYRLKPEEEEDYFYVWRIFALMMGIHPKGEPESFAYIPDNVQDAENFYDAYQKRHYVDSKQNPKGVTLADANLKMLEQMIPWYLRIIGFKAFPRIYMQELMGKIFCKNLDIRLFWGGPIIKSLILYLPVFISVLLFPLKFVTHKLFRNHEAFSMILFQDMIKKEYNGEEVTFTVPEDLKEWMDME